MSPIQIALLLLAVAGVWAIVELALTLRKTRTVVDSLDKTVNDLNNTIAEAQPVVAKLDGAVDELTPALAQMEPLLKSSKTAVDALTSNLVERHFRGYGQHGRGQQCCVERDRLCRRCCAEALQ